MASNLHNLKELVGESVVAVIVSRSDDGMRQAFIVLPDDTHVEVWVREGGVASRFPSGLRQITENLERDPRRKVTGTWVPR